MHTLVQSFWIFGAEYGFILVALGAIVLLMSLRGVRREQFVVFGIIDGALTYLAGVIAGALYYNPRPFISDNIIPLVHHAADNGFPSGHTLFCAMIAAACTPFSKRWAIVLWILTLWVGASRVYVGVHHWLDIVASILIASAVAFALAQSGLAEKAVIAARKVIGRKKHTTGKQS